jgi:peptidoglycan/xylan/chitin deacetylase (PgdA/CDA1 family)
MSANELQKLSQSGQMIGSHTLDHKYLPKQTDEEQAKQIIESKDKILAYNLEGQNIDFFAYPYCAYNNKSVEYVKKTGYKLAVSCAYRTGIRQEKDHRYDIRRLEIHNSMESLRNGLIGKTPW